MCFFWQVSVAVEQCNSSPFVGNLNSTIFSVFSKLHLIWRYFKHFSQNISLSLFQSDYSDQLIIQHEFWRIVLLMELCRKNWIRTGKVTIVAIPEKGQLFIFSYIFSKVQRMLDFNSRSRSSSTFLIMISRMRSPSRTIV